MVRSARDGRDGIVGFSNRRLVVAGPLGGVIFLTVGLYATTLVAFELTPFGRPFGQGFPIWLSVVGILATALGVVLLDVRRLLFEDQAPVLKRLGPRLALATVLVSSVAHCVVNLLRYAWPTRGSDFLGSFPYHRIAEWFGDPERFYLHYPMERHLMEQEFWNYGPIFHLVTFPMYLMPNAAFAYRGLLIGLVISRCCF